MSILKVARLGNPVLRQKAKEVTINQLRSEKIQRMIDDMIETLQEYSGVGLAAPQIHKSLRIAVMQIGNKENLPDEPFLPLTIFVNPVLKFLTDEKIYMWEGCLSIPDLRGMVPRFKSVELTAWNRFGKDVKLKLDDFPAVIVQHEFDHLDGILFVDRMEDMKTFTFMHEWQKYHLKEE